MKIRKDPLLIAKKFKSIMETKLCSKIFLTSSKFNSKKILYNALLLIHRQNLFLKDFLKVHFVYAF